jgi:hypothetical protein
VPSWFAAKKKIDEMRHVARAYGIPQHIPAGVILAYYDAPSITYNTTVNAIGEGATVRNVAVNVMTDEKRDGAEPAATVDVDARNQSSIEDINIQRGEGRIRATDRSAVSGVVVGGKPRKGSTHAFFKWGLPALLTALAGSAWYFSCRTPGGSEFSGGSAPAPNRSVSPPASK